ncbi:S41 family peptidase [Oceanicaulis sp.]|uniref:S41 family peptidase n=1 Tax=Oceanicaulis sp. TaxID=1924941 RepID=UPI003F71AB06
MPSFFSRSCWISACVGALQISLAPQAHADELDTVLDQLNSALHAHYVYPERVDQVTTEVGEILRALPASERDTPEELADVMGLALVEATGDLHFALGADRNWVAAYRDQETGEDEIYQQDLQWERSTNHGLHTLSILEGNVGYLRFDYFADPEKAYDSLVASMQFLAHVDALIIDLRYNRGGYMETGQLLSSYLFESDDTATFLEFFYNEDGERIERSHWVLPALPGERHPDTPVMILNGATTFSAAEWMAFSLQELGRATLVGEVTAGGAHPVDRFVLNDELWIQIPIGLVSSPVSGSDFEGVGVEPDIAVPGRDALEVAHLRLLRALAETQDEPALTWLEPILQARINPVTLNAEHLDRIAGRYEGRELYLQDGDLLYRWNDRFTLELTPLSDTVFAVEGGDGYRIEIIEQNNEVTGLRLVQKTGQTAVYDRLP